MDQRRAQRFRQKEADLAEDHSSLKARLASIRSFLLQIQSGYMGEDKIVLDFLSALASYILSLAPRLRITPRTKSPTASLGRSSLAGTIRADLDAAERALDEAVRRRLNELVESKPGISSREFRRFLERLDELGDLMNDLFKMCPPTLSSLKEVGPTLKRSHRVASAPSSKYSARLSRRGAATGPTAPFFSSDERVQSIRGESVTSFNSSLPISSYQVRRRSSNRRYDSSPILPSVQEVDAQFPTPEHNSTPRDDELEDESLPPLPPCRPRGRADYGLGPAIEPARFPENQWIDLDISLFHSPWLLYLFRPRDNARELITELLTDHYSKRDPMADRFQSFPAPGTTCAVFSFSFKQWYRGVVLELLPPIDDRTSTFLTEERILVHFLDFGDTERCSLNCLRQLEPAFSVFNAQAAGYTMSGVAPVRLVAGDSAGAAFDWESFHSKSDQFVVAEQFENALSGFVTTVHGRRFVDLVAFRGSSREGRLSDLLVRHHLADAVADEEILRRTVSPIPCHLGCPFAISVDGECRHGVVVRPLENLGHLDRFKPSTSTSDFAAIDSGEDRSELPGLTKPWNSRDKLLELIDGEMSCLFSGVSVEVAKRDHVQDYVLSLTETSRSVAGSVSSSSRVAEDRVSSSGTGRRNGNSASERSFTLDGQPPAPVSAEQRFDLNRRSFETTWTRSDVAERR